MTFWEISYRLPAQKYVTFKGSWFRKRLEFSYFCGYSRRKIRFKFVSWIESFWEAAFWKGFGSLNFFVCVWIPFLKDPHLPRIVTLLFMAWYYSSFHPDEIRTSLLLFPDYCSLCRLDCLYFDFRIPRGTKYYTNEFGICTLPILLLNRDKRKVSFKVMTQSSTSPFRVSLVQRYILLCDKLLICEQFHQILYRLFL